MKHIYTILQGSKRVKSDNYDMYEYYSTYTNKAEAVQRFNYLKHEVAGWVGDILISELWADFGTDNETLLIRFHEKI